MSSSTDLGTVWLVDDDASIRKALSRSLSKRGYTIETFESAELYLENASFTETGCLLLDLSMPGMSGLDLQEELNKRNINVPVIFITGHGGAPESEQALKNGAFDFLEKPFPQQILLDKINAAISLHRQTTETVC